MSTAVLDQAVAAPVTEAPSGDEGLARRIRLSEALRKGAQYHPQGRGHYFCRQAQTTCALGALAVGLFGPAVFETPIWAGLFEPTVFARTGVWLHHYLPGLARDPALRPLAERTGMGQCSLMQAIVYLNDGACWSREEIAAWLESLGL